MTRLHIQSEAQERVAAVIKMAIFSEIKRMEIVGFDRILPKLFGAQPGGEK